MHWKQLYQILKNWYHFFQAHAWRLIYGRPDRALTVFGVTGTNGKTTTCYLLASILSRHLGPEKVGMLTTVGLRVGTHLTTNATKLTTLPSRLVYRYVREMKRAGVTHVVLELTSHSLDQHRLAGMRLSGGIILNIEREHLDYHGTMKAYATAKARIVRYLRTGAPLIAKKDSGLIEQTLRAMSSIQPVWFTSEEASRLEVALEGEVNKENALAASLLARAVGIPQEAMTAGIADVRAVPGRMEWIDAPQGFRVLIDYAVTPQALERLYTYVRSKTAGKVYGILGAAGLRDRGKRPAMAKAVAAFADEVILTREDPWTEPEEQIFQDLEKGLPPSHSPLAKGGDRGVVWRRIVDRRQAIQYCLAKAGPGDVIVVTGKGAEQGMGIGKKVIPWNDRQVIEEILQKL